jgi:hypothetical protein
MIMMNPIQKNNSIIVRNDDNLQNMNHKTSSMHHKSIHGGNKRGPSIYDRVKLIYLDDEYSGLTQGICGTVSGIYTAKELSRSVNRPESIVWVKWDSGIELGLIEGIDEYEIVSGIITTTNSTQALQ